MLKTRVEIRAAVGFALAFLLFFAQLPLRGLLPGNTDSLLAIALSNLIREKIGLFLSGLPPFTAMYPARDILAYGENCYGLAFVFLFFRMLTRSDLWGYYLFIVTLFTANAWAVAQWVGLFVEGALIPWVAGLVFCLSGFTLANIDDPNVVFVALPLASLYCLERGVRDGDRRWLSRALFCTGLQIWFGFYVFVFQNLVLLILIPSRGRKLLAGGTHRDVLAAAAALLVPCLPLLLLYFHNHLHAQVVSPYDGASTAAQTSMSWHSFRNVLPGNLLYSEAANVFDPSEVGAWGRLRKTGFTGFALPVLALLGLALSFRKARGYLAIFVLFLALSFGVHLPGFSQLARLPLGGYFRVPARFHLFALLPLILFAALGLRWLVRRLKSRAAAVVVGLVAGAILLENVPFPLPGYAYEELLAPPDEYPRFFGGFARPAVILDLPSACLYRPGDPVDESERLFFDTRDILYMNWQTYHRQWIVGGVNSYVASSRAQLDDDLQRVPDPDSLRRLRSLGVEYIVFHKNLIQQPHESVLPRLQASPELRSRLETPRVAIFEIRPAS